MSSITKVTNKYYELQYGAVGEYNQGWAMSDFLYTLSKLKMIREVKTVTDSMSIWTQVYL